MSTKPVPTFHDAYHARQWETCYESTRAFFDFLETHGAIADDKDQHIVDLCTGTGSNLYWLKQRFPKLRLSGVEIDPRLVEWGTAALAERNTSGVNLSVGDVYDLQTAALQPADGVISLQTLSFLPDEAGFIHAAAAVEAPWIALTGLIIEGSHSFRTLINNHAAPEKGDNFYNTFALEYITQLLADEGYSNIIHSPFEIGIDLPKPADDGLGTYTEQTDDGRRLQISGAVLMSWQFVLARRI
tara:strand:+ start:103253 stop:103981 length:729 start_codon:yes stop_codon:yes gene_type:complete